MSVSMSEMVRARLGDLCQFKAGDAFKREFQGRGTGDYPFIKVSDMNLSGNEISITRSENWVNQEEVASNRYRLHDAGSVVFAKIGVALTYNRRRILRQPTIIDNNLMAAKPDGNEVHCRYFYYLLSTLDFNEIASGSALPYLTQKDLQKIELSFHQMPEQIRVASLLGVLDDKIELNRRMNDTQEAMARALFKDWFVDFGPTRAKAEGREPYLAPELWDLFPDTLDNEDKPAGWMSRTLDTLFDVRIGRTPPRKESHHFVPHGAGMTWLSIRTMGRVQTFATNSEEDLTLEAVEQFRVPVIDAGTVMVSFKLTVGRVAIAAEDMCSNEAIAQLRPRIDTPISLPFTYCFMKGFDYDSLDSTSSIATAVNSKSLRQIRAIVPDRATQAAFEALSQPIFDRILRNIRESGSLMAIRDLLLPKLMSGEIRLRDAEKAIEALA